MRTPNKTQPKLTRGKPIVQSTLRFRPEVKRAVEDRAHELRISATQVINDVLAAGLGVES